MPQEQILTSGIEYLKPGEAGGTDVCIDACGTISAHFINNVPYTVEMYAVKLSAWEEWEEYYKEYHTYYEKFCPNLIVITFVRAHSIYSCKGEDKHFEFNTRPNITYSIWFYNPTSNTDFEVEYKIYWKQK